MPKKLSVPEEIKDRTLEETTQAWLEVGLDSLRLLEPYPWSGNPNEIGQPIQPPLGERQERNPSSTDS
jgi:hypothetical protein